MAANLRKMVENERNSFRIEKENSENHHRESLKNIEEIYKEKVAKFNETILNLKKEILTKETEGKEKVEKLRERFKENHRKDIENMQEIYSIEKDEISKRNSKIVKNIGKEINGKVEMERKNWEAQRRILKSQIDILQENFKEELERLKNFKPEKGKRSSISTIVDASGNIQVANGMGIIAPISYGEQLSDYLEKE